MENLKISLKAKSKKEVFEIYCRICLGRIHSAQLAEMRKSWMIEDILKAKFGYLKTV